MTGTTRWSDGTEMVTLDNSHLTSVLWGVCKGFQARLDEVGLAGAEEAIRNMADARRRTIKAVYEDPRTGFGSIAQTLQQAQVRNPSISREEVKAFLAAERLDLAEMKAFGGKPYPFMLVAIDALTKKVARPRCPSTLLRSWP